ncbi:MAG: gamma-glutamyltransferase [Gemmatimonadota bacterium]
MIGVRPLGFVVVLATTVAAQDRQAVTARAGMVVSTSAPASEIGAAILARGGNAVDAAVATGFALAVTHPSAGNIGGGGFMIIRFPDGRATTIDYREKAPLASTPTMYLNEKGEINRQLTASGWLAPGVPGTVRGFALAHSKYGKLPWRDVVQPAADLASGGWELSPGLARAINGALRGQLGRHPSSTAAYGKPGGGEWAAGDRIILRDLGRTLNEIAASGPDAFYRGWIADSIASQMKANGGIITREDLARYKAVERPPVRGTFMGHEIISMPPPSSGGTVLIQTLNMLERFNIGKLAPSSPAFLHLRIEAARRAYLDRARHLGDPDFVQVPLDQLLSTRYAATLAAGIDTTRATRSAELGRDIVSVPVESDETTHYSVVDAGGVAIANTYTLEGGYGSGVVVQGAGFLLNNEMGDFNKKPGETNLTGDIGTAANLIAPEKRMLSSMSPAIVARDGKLRLVTGSPGGRTIPNTVLNVILGVVAFGLDVQSAVDLPRVHHQWLPDQASFERGVADSATVELLRAKGHTIRVSGGLSQGDAHSILFDPVTGLLHGAADGRSTDSKAVGVRTSR